MAKPETSAYRLGKHPPVRDYRTLRFSRLRNGQAAVPCAWFDVQQQRADLNDVAD